MFGRDVSGVSGAIWFVCAAVTFLSVQFGGSLVLGLPVDVRGAAGTLSNAAIMSAGAFGLASITAMVMLYLIEPRVSAGAGVRWRWSDLWVGAGCMALVAPVYMVTAGASAWVSTNVFGQPPPGAAHSGLRLFIDGRGSVWAWVFALVAVTLTPIAEEFIYRVYAQASVRSAIGGSVARVWANVLCVSGIFAITHAAGGGPVPWAAVPGLFVLAIGFGIAYERTARLGVPIVMHALFNAANLALAYWSA